MRSALLLSLGSLALASNVSAANIKLSDPGPGYIAINPEFIDVTMPRAYNVQGVGEFGPHHLSTTNTNPDVFPPVWVMQPFWVATADALFSFNPDGGSGHADANVAEFVNAGDTSLTWRINTTSGSWETVTWISPHLGTVTRTYPNSIPEPAGVALAAVALGVLIAARQRR